MVVQNNISAMNSHRLLTQNNNALSGNLEKLSSGYQINRAADDAAGLAISEKMRAQLQGLEAAEKNANDGISLVQTAEGALAEVHSMLSRMAYLATQSANGTYSDEERSKLQSEVSALNEEIDRISQSTQFNGIDLLQNGQRLDVPDVITENIPTQNDTNGIQTISTTIGATEGSCVNVEVATSIGKGVVEFVYSETATALKASVSTSGNVQIIIGGAMDSDPTGDDLTLAVKTAASAAGLTDLYSDYKITLEDPYDKDETTTEDEKGQYLLAAMQELDGNDISSVKISGVYDSSASPAGNMALSISLGGASSSPKVAVSGGVEGATIQFKVDDISIGMVETATSGVLITSDQSGNITVTFASGAGSYTQDDINAAIKIAQASASTSEQKAALAGLNIEVLTGKTINEADMKLTSTGSGYVNTDKVFFQEVPSGASTVEVNGIKDVVDDYMLNVSGGMEGAKLTVNYSDSFSSATPAVKVSISDSGDITLDFNNSYIDSAGKITQSDIDTAIQEALKNLVDDGDSIDLNATKIQGLQDLQINIQGGSIKFEDTPNPSTAEISSGSKLVDVDSLSTGYKPGDIVLQVGETRDDFQQVTVEIFDMDSKSLKLDDVDISYLEGAQAAIEKINNAIDAVSAVRSSFGAIQNRLDHTINNLGVASENLQAAESRIRDTDMAAEMMNYTKNNILIQSSQAMLSQANQVPQGVLQLLQ